MQAMELNITQTQGIAGRVTYPFDDKYLPNSTWVITAVRTLLKDKDLASSAGAVGYLISNEDFGLACRCCGCIEIQILAGLVE